MKSPVVFIALVVVYADALSPNKQPADVWFSELWLLDVDFHQPVVRVKRSMNLHENCCGQFELDFQNVEDVKNYCRNKFGIEGRENKCRFINCFTEKQGITDSDGLVMDKFPEYMSNRYLDDSLKRMAKDFAQDCQDSMNYRARELFNKGYCYQTGYYAITCTKSAMELECPEDKKVKNAKCNMIRGKLIAEERERQERNKQTQNVMIL